LNAKRKNNNAEEEESQEFLSAQKLETVQEFAAYHDGTWRGTRVTSFGLTSDVAAGVVARKDARCLKDADNSNNSLYTTTVETRLESSGLQARETLEWRTSASSESQDSILPNVARRVLKMGESVDIDSVDGSYSLDASLPFWNDVPSMITGLPEGTLVKFGIEHCIATSDHSRVRNMLLYDMTDQLCRVVVCDEERVITQTTDENSGGDGGNTMSSSKSDFSSMNDADELEAASKDIDDLVGRLLGEQPSASSSSKNKDSNNNTGNDIIDATIVVGKGQVEDNAKPKVKGPITADTPVEERMAQLNQAMGNSSGGKGGGGKGGGGEESSSPLASTMSIQRAPMSLFSLVSGVWLGDAIVRNHFTPSSNKKRKGFSLSSKTTKPKPDEGAGMSDGFAEWVTGVQKVALFWKWDFADRIMERLTAGRSMGVQISPHMPTTSRGILIMSDMARGQSPEDRLAYVDYDMGQYAAFLLGSVYMKAPRQLKQQLSGDNDEGGPQEVQPFYTEFAVFQKQQPLSLDGNSKVSSDAPSSDVNDNKTRLQELVAQAKAMEGIMDDNNDNENGNNGNGPEKEVSETHCSRLTRFYDSSGKLRQGTSAFFKLDTGTAAATSSSSRSGGSQEDGNGVDSTIQSIL
jgi:hypothetical protein